MGKYQQTYSNVYREKPRSKANTIFKEKKKVGGLMLRDFKT